MTPEQKRLYNKRYYAKKLEADPEFWTKRSRKWKKSNPEKVKILTDRYRRKNLTYYAKAQRAWRRKQLVAPPPYEPPAHCEACNRPLLKPNLDHCHVTNRFRGWICNPCNAALGLAGDTAESVRRLLDYIVRAEAVLDSQLLE